MAEKAHQHICTTCGEKIETPGQEGTCYGCRLDSLVPPGYERRESYYTSFLGTEGQDGRLLQVTIRRARFRPPTGVPVLDGPAPPRVVDLAAGMPSGYLEHCAIAEARQGLDDHR